MLSTIQAIKEYYFSLDVCEPGLPLLGFGASLQPSDVVLEHY